LLTVEFSHRKPYELAVGQVKGHFATLRQLCVRRPVETLFVVALPNLMTRKLAELDVGKHAEARETTIVLKNDGTHVNVEVSDNRKRFVTVQLRAESRGLPDMKHRADAAQGKIDCRVRGEGTRLIVMLSQAPQPVQT